MGLTQIIQKAQRWFLRSVPGALLLLAFVDDLVFGSLMVGAPLVFGVPGLLIAGATFIAFSMAIASATSWPLVREPLVLSPRSRARVTALSVKRFGRYLVPHPGRMMTTAVGAAVFG